MRLLGAARGGLLGTYLLSDVPELAQDGLPRRTLVLTLRGGGGGPFVVGLAWAQRRRPGALGRLAALAYACGFVFFAATVVDALVAPTPDWAALQNRLARRPRLL